MSGRVYVLLPAYNESEVLGTLVPAIGKELQSRSDFEVLVVDDGSRDSTAAVCESLKSTWPVCLLRHPVNQGYGAAIRTGILWIAQNAQGDDVAVTLDADMTHLPQYIPALIQKLDAGLDVVTASYRLPGGAAMGVPWSRRIMSDVINALFRWSVRKNQTTCMTNGFRAYRVSALQNTHRRWGEALIRQNGFPGGAELFFKVLLSGGRDGEVPFTLHYENRGSKSKIRIVQTIRAYLQLIKDLRTGL